jgi:hypothetical protein
MQTLERGFAVRIYKILNKASKDVAESVETIGQSADIEAVLSDLPAQLNALFIPHYTRTVEIFGRRLLNAFKSFEGYETKAGDVFSETMQEWIKRTSADKVVLISDVTKKRIRAAINDGFGRSLTGPEVAREIMGKTGGEIAKARALTIARTETHMAASEAGLEAVKSTGVQARKIWISAEDERTRVDHIATDKESHAAPLAMDEMFSVGGDSMPAPGLGSDPAQNVNCRCVLGWVTK